MGLSLRLMVVMHMDRMLLVWMDVPSVSVSMNTRSCCRFLSWLKIKWWLDICRMVLGLGVGVGFLWCMYRCG